MNISVSDVQNYLLNFFASPLQFNGDCSDVNAIVEDVKKDKETEDNE